MSVESDTIIEFGIMRGNEERRDGGCAVVFDPQSQKYAVSKHDHDGFLRLFAGGLEPGEEVETGVLRELTEESGLHDFLYTEKIAEAFVHYHNRLKNVNRVALATCFLVILKSTDCVPPALEEHEKFTLYWATPEEIRASWQSENEHHDYDHWIYFLEKSVARAVELGYDNTDV